MRDLPSAIQAQIGLRAGVKVRVFAWFKARNINTGEIETLGVWNGDDTQVFTVNGVQRTYVGAGGIIGVGEMKQYVGLNIRQLPLTCSHVSPEMAQLLRGYEVKLSPCEVHQGHFSTETNELLAPLQRVFKGWVNTMPYKVGSKTSPGSLTINLVGNTRLLTKTAPLRRSHETQLRRRTGDAFFQDVSITGTVQTAWGSKTVGGSTASGGGSPSDFASRPGLINLALQQR